MINRQTKHCIVFYENTIINVCLLYYNIIALSLNFLHLAK